MILEPYLTITNRAFKIMEFQSEFSERLEALERRFEGTTEDSLMSSLVALYAVNIS